MRADVCHGFADVQASGLARDTAVRESRLSVKDSVILAIDPGLGTFGWSVVDPAGARVIALGLRLSEPTASVDEHTDRARRIDAQADAVAELARRYQITEIALESMSFGGAPKARFAMAVSICLSWGAAAGVASSFGIDLSAVPPKRWERAVVPNAGKRVNYDQVESAVTAYVRRFQDPAVQLAQIAKGQRNHAIDSVGVGLFAALRPHQVEVICRRRSRSPRKHLGPAMVSRRAEHEAADQSLSARTT